MEGQGGHRVFGRVGLRPGRLRRRDLRRRHLRRATRVPRRRLESSIKPSCLYAVDARSGQEKWNFEIGGLSLSKPVVSDGAVYIGTYDGLHALDARSGQEKWEFATAGQGWALAVSDGLVLRR